MIKPHVLTRLALALLVILVLSIFIGGTAPGAGKLFPAPWDKVVHFFVYGAIGLLLGLAFPRLPLWGVWLLVVATGAADEVHQIFLPGRQAGFDDLLADALGSLLMLPVLAWARRFLLSQPDR